MTEHRPEYERPGDGNQSFERVGEIHWCAASPTFPHLHHRGSDNPDACRDAERPRWVAGTLLHYRGGDTIVRIVAVEHDLSAGNWRCPWRYVVKHYARSQGEGSPLFLPAAEAEAECHEYVPVGMLF